MRKTFLPLLCLTTIKELISLCVCRLTISGQFEMADCRTFHLSLRMPEFVIRLQGGPEGRTIAKCCGKLYCHFGADTCPAVNNRRNIGPCQYAWPQVIHYKLARLFGKTWDCRSDFIRDLFRLLWCMANYIVPISQIVTSPFLFTDTSHFDK